MAQQVAEITGLSVHEATRYLEMSAGSVEGAVTLFFEMQGGGGATPPPLDVPPPPYPGRVDNGGGGSRGGGGGGGNVVGGGGAGGAGPSQCTSCRRAPANAGYEWCGTCYQAYRSQRGLEGGNGGGRGGRGAASVASQPSAPSSRVTPLPPAARPPRSTAEARAFYQQHKASIDNFVNCVTDKRQGLEAKQAHLREQSHVASAAGVPSIADVISFRDNTDEGRSPLAYAVALNDLSKHVRSSTWARTST